MIDNATREQISHMDTTVLFTVMELLNCCTKREQLLIAVGEEWLLRQADQVGRTDITTPQKIVKKHLESTMVELEGEKMSAADAASLCGLEPKHVIHRVNHHGWSLQDAATRPLARRRT